MAQVPPVITSVTYRGKNIRVTWTDASTNVLVTGYVVMLTQVDGHNTPWGNYSTEGSELSLSFEPDPDFLFNPQYAYSAQVFGYSSENPNGLGSTNTMDVANVILAPTITSVVCDGERTTVAWDDPTLYPGPNRYVLLLATPSGAVNIETPDILDAPQWTFEMPEGSPPNGTYTVRLFGSYTGGSGPGPGSTNTPNILLQTLLPSSVTTASLTSVAVSWPAATESGVTAYNVYLMSEGATVTSMTNVSTTTTTLTTSANLSETAIYEVMVQVTGTSTIGPVGPSIPVIVAAPTLQLITCTPEGLLTVTWSGVSAPWVKGYLVTYTGAQTFSQSASDTGITLYITPTGTASVTVAAIGFNTQGPNAMPEKVLALAPEITSVSYSNGVISASWIAPSYGSQTVDYGILLFDGGTFIASNGSGNTATGGTLTHTLTAGRNYTIRLQVTNAGSLGPSSADFPVIVGTPSITSAVYDGTNLSLNWSTVNEPGVLAYSVTAGGTTVTVSGTSVTLPLALTASATAQVTAIGAATTGPAGASLALAAAAPEISAVSYASGTISVTWSVASSPSGATYQLALFDAEGFLQSATSGNTATAASLTATLTAGRSYSVRGRVLGGNAIGPWSGDVPVIVGTPAVTSAVYDGANLALNWSAVNEPGVLAYSVTAGGTTVTVNGTSATLPLALTSGATAQVTAIGAATTGPAGASLALAVAAPEISAVSYASGTITVTWSVASSPSGATYELALFDAEGFLQSATSGNTATAASLTATLTAGRDYSVRGRVIASNAIGPWSGDVPVIVGTPAVTSAVYDGASLALNWSAVNEPGVLAYSVTAGGTTVTVNGTSATLPLALTSGATAQVTAIGAATTGPAGTSLTLATAAPEISAVSYASGTISVTWSVASSPSGATYELALFDAEGFLQSATSGNTATAASLTATLTAGRDYTVRGRVIAANAVGPWSGDVPVIVGSPAITSAVYDGASLALNWSAVNEPGVLAYAVLAGGQTTTVNGTSVTLPLALSSGATAQVTAIGAATGGPSGASLSLATAAPEISAVSYASGTISVTWSVASSPSGATYELALFDAEGFLRSATSGNTATSASLTATLTAGRNYSVRGRVVAANAIGPWSGDVPVIVGTPAINSASYDGANVTLSWSAVSEPGALAYSVTIGSTTIVSNATTLTMPLPLAAGSSTSVSIHAVGPATTGPASSTTIALPAALSLNSVSYDGAMITAKWTALQSAVTGYRIDVAVDYAPLLSTIAQNAATDTATITAALDPDAVVFVTITPLNGAVTGVTSSALQLIAAAPQLEQVFYNGTTINASWAPVASPAGVTYRLSLMSGATEEAFATTSGTSATLTPQSVTAGEQVIVAAWLGTTSNGPSSAGIDPTTGATEFFFSPTAATVGYTYRSGQRPPLATTPAAVVLYFPNLFTGQPPTQPPAGAFTLGTVSNAGQIKYSITVASSVWTFSTTAIRTTLRQQYLAFLEWLEDSLAPGAAMYLRRALAVGMPLSFAETLLYAYGLNPASGYVDLVPGMKLRLDAEMYQYVPQASAQGIVGFTGNGSQLYDLTFGPINTNGVNLAFDAFLSLLASTTIGSGAGGAGGILDLYGPGGLMPYYRIFYPANFPASNSQGSVDPSQNVALVGAATISDLETATTRYLQQGNFNGIPSSTVSVFFFRGRMVALPRITVALNGANIDVSVGTTLRQLIGSWANLPFAEALPVGSIALIRPTGGVLDSSTLPATLPAAQANVFNFSDQTLVTYSNNQDWFDVPLLGGDEIVIG